MRTGKIQEDIIMLMRERGNKAYFGASMRPGDYLKGRTIEDVQPSLDRLAARGLIKGSAITGFYELSEGLKA